MRCFRLHMLALVFILAPAAHSAASSVYLEENGFAFFVSTEQDTYVAYEDVPIEFTVTNISSDTLGFFSPCSGVFMCLIIRNPQSSIVRGYFCACDDEISYQLLAPASSYVREPVWDMRNMYHTLINRMGTYTVEASFAAYDGAWRPIGCDLALSFEVVRPVASVPEAPRTWGTIKALYR